MKPIAKIAQILVISFIFSANSSCNLTRNVVSVSIPQDQPVNLQSKNGSNHLPVDYPVKAIRFSHLTSKDGLSQSVVTSIFQDDFGYIWFGTEDGLNKFDGKNITIFRNDPDDKQSLSSNDITSITQSPDGAIWIGTMGGGLNKYNRETGIFTHYKHIPTDTDSLSSDYVRTLLYDADGGYLWIGTLGGGLNRLDLISGKFKQYLQESKQTDSISSNDVLSLAMGGHDTLWVGTAYGLDKLQISKNSFTNYRTASVPVIVTRSAILSLFGQDDILLIGSEAGLFLFDHVTNRIREIPLNPENTPPERIPVRSILYSKDGYYWVGTYDFGLFRLSSDLNSIDPILSDPRNPSSLSDNRVYSLLEDKSGILWIGTYSGFVNYINPLKNRFKSLEFSPWLSNSISNSMIWAVLPEKNNKLWIGTDGGGLNLYDFSTGSNKVFKHDQNNENSIDNDHIHSIYIDKSGKLWVGTDAGLNQFDETENAFKHIQLRQNTQPDEYDRKPAASPIPLQILSIAEDHMGKFWFGTGGAGLYRLDPSTGIVDHFEYQPGYSTLLPSNLVWALYPDIENILWIATNRGLVKLNILNMTSTTYLPSENQRGSISDYRVLCMLRDSRGILWFGTASGLNKYDDDSNSFSAYRMKDGLPNDFIYSIQEDSSGILWLSTNKGISKFNSEEIEFINFGINAGLAGDEYNQGAGAKSENGQIFFGGVFGITYFRPDEIYTNKYQPDVFLTSLTQGGQPIIQNIPLEIINSIQLNWPKNYFEFSFHDQNSFVTENTQYAYRLSPFEKDWVTSETIGQGRYTNLPGGEYQLWLRTSDEKGDWYPEKKVLNISIVPPLWEDRNFLIIFSISFLVIISGLVFLRIQAAQRRTRELAQLVRLRTKEIDQRRLVAEGLREILTRINSNKTLEDSLSFIADQICQIMMVNDVVIAKCDNHTDKKSKLMISSSQNTEIECQLVNLIYQRIQEIEKVSQSPEDLIQTIQPLEIGFKTPAKTITCLPVYLDGQIEAILILFTHNSRIWSTEERELITSFAEQIALALGNAKLRNNTAELAMLNERNRLARDLHDAVTQTLFSASLLAEAFPGVWEKNHDEGKKLIQEMRQLTRGALAEMRSMLMELRPASMAEAKLADLIRQLAEAVAGRTGLTIELSVPNDIYLPSDVNVTLYRIAQEALTNIVKHAKAQNVKIYCTNSESRTTLDPKQHLIRMVIEDDGCGFETKKIAQDHFGLYNMRERADSIEAVLEISSTPGRGTKVIVEWKGEESTGDDK